MNILKLEEVFRLALKFLISVFVRCLRHMSFSVSEYQTNTGWLLGDLPDNLGKIRASSRALLMLKVRLLISYQSSEDIRSVIFHK